MADNSLITKSQLRKSVDATIDAIEAAMYTHPSHTARTSGLYKVTVDNQGHVTAVTAVTKADITGLGVPAQDTVYTHPTHTAYNSGLYKIAVDASGHVTAATAVTKSDITALGIPSADTTYSAATTSAAGLMSAADKAKLDGIEEGASAGGGVPIATATSSDGAAYVATVDGVDSLSVGTMVMFVSATTSTSTAPTLNVNGLGAKTIKRRLSGLSSTTAAGTSANWLYANKPQLLMYDGTYWIVVNQDKPQVTDLYGSSDLVQYANSVLSTLGGTSIDLGGAKIATGSYTGTGTYGSANPCSLTFDFVPKFIVILCYPNNGCLNTPAFALISVTQEQGYSVAYQNVGCVPTSTVDFSNYMIFAGLSVSAIDTTVKFYSGSNAYSQMNVNGSGYVGKYGYIALG